VGGGGSRPHGSPTIHRAVTSLVFRDGRPSSSPGTGWIPANGGSGGGAERGDSILSVPIRYTPPTGSPHGGGDQPDRPGRGGRFTASDQKLLSAIASQVGAALENHRLMEESLEQERMGREMELAHNLQMKLLPARTPSTRGWWRPG
jgi:phosphoserine phosphatase RsbU/P